jgi:hypothetical protein
MPETVSLAADRLRAHAIAGYPSDWSSAVPRHASSRAKVAKQHLFRTSCTMYHLLAVISALKRSFVRKIVKFYLSLPVSLLCWPVLAVQNPKLPPLDSTAGIMKSHQMSVSETVSLAADHFRLIRCRGATSDWSSLYHASRSLQGQGHEEPKRRPQGSEERWWELRSRCRAPCACM